ncbi:MAG TPA: glycerol-3-phosphate dehydrogenase/oxidase [Frankiaceae bacterium]|jgi:glycerol-3-phosphate dehydrogenase|nr:glycerol-3-phosphate dehydrogenase/oxidase [Frankiaceae bacterium]
MEPVHLSPEARIAALERLESQTFDVVVVGGGVVGTGCALDAATRGLSTALLEARDWAAGTSSRSSKLIHGGLRYLEQLEFGLVREALRERHLMLTRLCPHLVQPVSFVYPLRHRVWERAYAGSGVLLYDTLLPLGTRSTMRERRLPHHRHLSRRKALTLAPALRKDSLVGALQYYDAQVDDARHTMTIARTAAAYGATAATGVQVTGFLREGERVSGVRVCDRESGREFDVRARVVVNATGVWTDATQELAGGRGRFQVRASKGIHLVVPRDRLQLDTGLIIRTEHSVLFVIPWGRHWIIGTTDTDWKLSKAHPAASSSDIDYVLDHLNAVLVTPLSREDVEGVYAGLRPLLAGESELTSKLSREHLVAMPVPGLVVVAGGKYTTYRVMARDAIDRAAGALEQKVADCVTDEIPLIGAEGYPAMWNRRRAIAESSGLHPARIEHLLHRYGSMIDELLALIRERPELATPLPNADDYLQVEVVYSAMAEGALHLDDILTRRTRISIEAWDRGLAAAVPAAALIGEVLGWDDERREREIEYYRRRVAAERDSQTKPDDTTADAARMAGGQALGLGAAEALVNT